MNAPTEYLNPTEAARKLGVSVKALRIYEQRGLIEPTRTEAGWRTYGPKAMDRASEIVALRAMGLSLAQIANALGQEDVDLDALLAAHQSLLEGQMRQIAEKAERVRQRRSHIARRQPEETADETRTSPTPAPPAVVFELPWPWGGERFELLDIHPLNYVIGPLGSGKTRLAHRLAETLPGGVFIGLDRLADGAAKTKTQLAKDPGLSARVEEALTELAANGAERSDALLSLLAVLERDCEEIPVIDLIEQGLHRPSQRALIAYLRGRRANTKPLFIITRSSAILDLDRVGVHESIILCPANHSPPTPVTAYPGAPGYEAVATCLATPEIRARTEGVIAIRTNPQ
ncbi:MerR family transcriptional regulator [Hoeflea poritis]|uniref:MerR family transcriptional regulator n=1 Tax=Hoeflea poritis TaxID=2993659 RepID=A0ABT4VQE8_9HYPH|nr:MerR family transcriptional regulator [Hoeflea poritis]MDA4846934.1 MerR family transcriptional regulator [Hoeflea poritis]